MDSGGIQVSTTLRDQTLELGIATEHTDTAQALRMELPSLDVHLREHALRLGEAQITASSQLTSNMSMNWQGGNQRNWDTPRFVPLDSEGNRGTVEEVAVWNRSQAGEHVSLLA
jgi:hypothetical protein